MKEHEIRDYLYDHPEVLFPAGNITEKARECVGSAGIGQVPWSAQRIGGWADDGIIDS